MKHLEYKLFTRRLILKRPFNISHGTYHWRDNVFVAIVVGDIVGLGEAPVVPYYGDTVDSITRDLVANVTSDLIRDSLESGQIGDTGFASGMSRCAFATAILDVMSKQNDQSLGEFLGSTDGPIAPTSYTIAFNEDVDEMVTCAKGHPRLKVKIGFPRDVEHVRTLRERYPDAVIRLDVNQGWELSEALQKARQLEELKIEFIEEPLSGTFESIQTLAAATSIPVVLDEHVVTRTDLERCIEEAPGVAGVVAKIAKSGGPDATLDFVRHAREAGLRVMVSSMVESSLGVTAAAHLVGGRDWCDLDSPLLIDDDPFIGLEYAGDDIVQPSLTGVGASPTEETERIIGELSPVFTDS